MRFAYWRQCCRQVHKLNLIKVLLVCSFLVLGFGNKTFAQNSQKVYVCNSPYASCFHFDIYCNGLNARKHPLITISVDSIPAGLKPCKLCVKKSFKPKPDRECKRTNHAGTKTRAKKKKTKQILKSPLEDYDI